MEVDAAVLSRALEREKKRRAHAEQLLEEKSRELFASYQQLQQAHQTLQANQTRLVQAEKMASLGVMCAGVAHEINTPMGFVSSNLSTLASYLETYQQLLQRNIALVGDAESENRIAELAHFIETADLKFEVEDALELIGETLAGTGRVQQIVEGLEAFTNATSGDVRPLDLNQLVRTTLGSGTCDVPDDVQLERNLAQGELTIEACEAKVARAFSNVFANSLRALRDVTPARLDVSTCRDHRGAVLAVADNGCGIAQEHLDKIFTPFFTTQAVGNGVGLGLTIAFGVMQEIGGTIEAHSEPEKGTLFELVFPMRG